jgi:hypothetical protein
MRIGDVMTQKDERDLSEGLTDKGLELVLRETLKYDPLASITVESDCRECGANFRLECDSKTLNRFLFALVGRSDVRCCTHFAKVVNVVRNDHE